MFSFWWEGAKWTLARNNLSALWVGNCNCFILVFIMNMHPLLLLDNSQSKGSGRPLAKKIGYRVGSGRVVRKCYRQKANIWEINVRQIIIIANGINSQPPKLQTALVWVLDERNQKKSSKYDFQDDGHISSSPVVPV